MGIRLIKYQADILPLIKQTMPGEVYSTCEQGLNRYSYLRTLYGYYLSSGELVGCSGYVENEGKLWISWTAVLPEHQGLGIGKRLLQKCFACLPNKDIYVETYEHPAFFNAIAFYLKSGFRLCGYLDDYLLDGSKVLYFKRPAKKR